MTKIQINNEVRDMTAEEEAQRQADLDARATEISTALSEKETTDNLKASAKAKLMSGEAMTEEEANTIVL